MAEPKKQVLTQVLDPSTGFVRIWTDNPARREQEILNTAGVSSICSIKDDSITIFFDPRYDMYEVIADLEQLLTSEVPDVLK